MQWIHFSIHKKRDSSRKEEKGGIGKKQGGLFPKRGISKRWGRKSAKLIIIVMYDRDPERGRY